MLNTLFFQGLEITSEKLRNIIDNEDENHETFPNLDELFYDSALKADAFAYFLSPRSKMFMSYENTMNHLVKATYVTYHTISNRRRALTTSTVDF